MMWVNLLLLTFFFSTAKNSQISCSAYCSSCGECQNWINNRTQFGLDIFVLCLDTNLTIPSDSLPCVDFSYVQNITFNGKNSRIMIDGYRFAIKMTYSSNITILNFHFEATTYCPIISGSELEEIGIKNNWFEGTRPLYIESSNKITYKDNQHSPTSQCLVQLRNGVSNVKISHNKDVGTIQVENGEHLSILNNIITYYVSVKTFSGNIVIENNELTVENNYGFEFIGVNDALVKNNQVKTSSNYGMTFESSSNAIIEGNVLESNRILGLYLKSGNGYIVKENYICGFHYYDVMSTSSDSISYESSINNTCLTTNNDFNCTFECVDFVEECECSSFENCTSQIEGGCMKITLVGDLIEDNPNVILIEHGFNFKTIDCNGHMIKGYFNIPRSRNITIKNCKIISPSYSCFYGSGGSTFLGYNNNNFKLINNDMECNWGSLFFSYHDYFVNSLFLNNRFSGGNIGLEFDVVEHSTFEGNIFEDTNQKVMYIKGGDGIVIKNNIIRNNDIGLYFEDPGKVTFEGNIAYGNGKIAIWFGSEYSHAIPHNQYAIFKNNTITQNMGIGIYIKSARKVLLEENTLKFNRLYGIYVNSFTINVTLIANHICLSKVDVYFEDPSIDYDGYSNLCDHLYNYNDRNVSNCHYSCPNFVKECFVSSYEEFVNSFILNCKKIILTQDIPMDATFEPYFGLNYKTIDCNSSKIISSGAISYSMFKFPSGFTNITFKRCIFQMTASEKAFYFVDITSPYVSGSMGISHFVFENCEFLNGEYGIFSGTSQTFEHFQVRNCAFEGISENSIYFYNSNLYSIIEENRFVGTGGVYLRGSDECEIRNNQFINGVNDQVELEYAREILVLNNFFNGGDASGIRINMNYYSDGPIFIIGNIIRNMLNHGIDVSNYAPFLYFESNKIIYNQYHGINFQHFYPNFDGYRNVTLIGNEICYHQYDIYLSTLNYLNEGSSFNNICHYESLLWNVHGTYGGCAFDCEYIEEFEEDPSCSCSNCTECIDTLRSNCEVVKVQNNITCDVAIKQPVGFVFKMFDCEGNSIFSSSHHTFELSPGSNHIKIVNCHIYTNGDGNAIFLTYPYSSLISSMNVTFDNNHFYGGGVYICRAIDVFITNNYFSECGKALQFSTVKNVLIENNRFVQTSGTYLGWSSNNVKFDRNIFISTTEYAIHVEKSSEFVHIYNGIFDNTENGGQMAVYFDSESDLGDLMHNEFHGFTNCIKFRNSKYHYVYNNLLNCTKGRNVISISSSANYYYKSQSMIALNGNIVGGPLIQGNFWNDFITNGSFTDSNGDGIADGGIRPHPPNEVGIFEDVGDLYPLTLGPFNILGISVDDLHYSPIGKEFRHRFYMHGGTGIYNELKMTGSFINNLDWGGAANANLRRVIWDQPSWTYTSLGNGEGILEGISTTVEDYSFWLKGTDSIGASIMKSFRKRVLLSAPSSQLVGKKIGTFMVPGRITPFFICIRNLDKHIPVVTSIYEFVEPFMTVVSANPPPDRWPTFFCSNKTYSDEDRARIMYEENYIRWDIEIGPGKTMIIEYNVFIHPETPLQITLHGPACPIQKGCRRDVGEAIVKKRLILGTICVIETVTAPATFITNILFRVRNRLADMTKFYLKSAGVTDAYIPKFLNRRKLAKYYNCEEKYKYWMNKLKDKVRKCNKLNCYGSGRRLMAGEDCGEYDLWDYKRRVTRSKDPNEKRSSNELYIKPDEVLVYSIWFENIGNATARDVFLKDYLDITVLNTETLEVFANLDGNVSMSFIPVVKNVETLFFQRFKNITIGEIFNKTLYETLEERWVVLLDDNGLLTFSLYGIDLAGNATDKVIFQITPISNLTSGSVIRNNATIQFEQWEIIETNNTYNIIDTTPPVCEFLSINYTQTSNKSANEAYVTVFWEGYDEVGEISHFYLYFSSNRSEPMQMFPHKISADEKEYLDEENWFGRSLNESENLPYFIPFKFTSNSLTIIGKVNKTYGFTCVAVDTARNSELKEPLPEIEIHTLIVVQNDDEDPENENNDLWIWIVGILSSSFVLIFVVGLVVLIVIVIVIVCFLRKKRKILPIVDVKTKSVSKVY